MKQHGAIFAVFGGLYLALDHWLRRRGSWTVVLRKLWLLLLGTVIPLGLTVLALWHAGVLPKFWFWTVTYASDYARELPFSVGIVFFRFMFPRAVGAT